MRPSRLLAAAIVGPLTGGILALIPAPAFAQQQDPSAAAEEQLKDQSAGKVTVRRDDRGVVHFVGAQPGKPVQRPTGVAAADSPARQAKGYLQRYGALWALDAQGSDVRATRTTKAGKGTVVRFQQTVDGTPVLGGELAVALDNGGNLQSVSGETTPLALPEQDLAVTEAQAEQTARGLVARLHKVPASGLTASAPQAFAYDAALLGPAKAAGLVPVWKIEVTGPASVRHLVLVDRARGSVVLQFNQVSNLDRMVCDRENQRDTTSGGDPTLATCTVQAGTTDRSEGGAPSASADVNAAYDYTGDTAAYYDSEVGVDLTEMIGYGSTKRLRSTVRYCLPSSFDPDCPMQNAFWNGNGVYYGAGMPKADDIVAHELTHGVIEKTANLAYFYQSGAINESMADVFGELVDLNNADAETETPWNLGEGSPFPGGGQVRDMEDPGLYGQPDRMTSSNYYAEPFHSDGWDNGGVHVNSGVGNKAAYLIARPASDGSVSFNGHSITGIGHAKAADVYYQTLQMLTSGADYEDLYSVLPQACANLAAGGVGGINAADCTTVSQAVQATEMNQQPPVGKAPEAPVCDSGTKKSLFTDGFEGSLSNWSRTSGMWLHHDGYAKTGAKSLYGLEPVTKYGDPRNSYARLARNFTVPSGVKTYLRFDHQYLLLHDINPETYYDGALLTYSTDGGKTFKSAAVLPWVNGPNRTIKPWDSGTSYKGWGGDSNGYMSSRVDVSSLAGKSVMFRWRITGDTEYSFDGWTLDNVNLYLCGGDTPSNATSVGATGGYGRATVKWQPPLWPGSTPVTKYQVLVYQRGGTLVKNIDGISPAATSKVVTGLSHGRTYTFYVKPHNASGPGPISGKKLIGTVQPSTLSPTTIYRGSSTKFSGKLQREDTRSGIRGVKVYLQYRKKGSSSAFADLTYKYTGTYGSYSFIRKPSSSAEYRVVYKSGGTTYMGSRTATRTVTVRS